MSTVAKSKASSDFKPVPAGTHAAVCTMVVDMGVQPGGKFKPKHQIYLRWEIPAEVVEWTDAEGNKKSGPAVIGRTYTLSLSEKANLRADLESWRGRLFSEAELAGFDVADVLGKPCVLGITHKQGADGKTYANVATVSGLMKGLAKPVATGKLLKYDIDNHDPAVFDQLPGWLQTKINDRVPDAAETVQANGSSEPEFDDEIPF